MLQVVWFKRDLRTADHAPLIEAARSGPVLPLYTAEPELWQQPDGAARRWAFTAECLEELQDDLGELGQPLVIRTGDAVDVLEALRNQVGELRIWSHEETGSGWTYARDRRVRAWARAHAVDWIERPQFGIVRGLRDRRGWAGKWDRRMAEEITRPPSALPPVGGIDIGHIPAATDLGLSPDPCPDRPTGGRRAGMLLLESFLAERGIRYHREMSSPNTAFASCSRLSAHFATGTVSMREAAQAAWARMLELRNAPRREGDQRLAALRAFVGRLYWHCHFMQKLEDQPSLEFENQHRAYDGLREGAFDRDRYDAWAAGETGFPFVDACMRALASGGWINFRMRAMLASFSAYHLWLHWREPALHLARLFIDYEPGIHYPQMQMQSGTTGINTARIYNPVKQSKDHDPKGRFIRRFVPELERVPDQFVHEPWTMPAALQRQVGCEIGRDYPRPVVDHVAAARAARERIYAVRGGAAYRAEADAIQRRHGSRKSGLPPSNPSRRRRPQRQLDLDI